MSQRWSARYRQFDDPEIFLDTGYLHDLIGRIEPMTDAAAFATVADAVGQTREWSQIAALAHAELLRNAALGGIERQAIQACLRQSAPMGLALGSCLQNMSAPGVFEHVLHLRLLALLADDLGPASRSASRSDEFRSLLRRSALCAYAVPRAELAAAREIEDAGFALPAALLGLSRRSDHFGPELCGIDLVFRAAHMLPCWTAIRALHPAVIDWRRLDPGSAHDAWSIDPLSTASAIAQQLCVNDALRSRVLRGAGWMLASLHRWDAWLLELVRESLNPHAAMAKLIRTRARDAVIYHQHYRLGQRHLCDYFKTGAADPAPLLEALARSPLVTPGSSRSSPLVNALLAPDGKMFRVFTPDEVEVISRWIDALPQANFDLSLQQRGSAAAEPPPPPVTSPPTENDIAPRDIRDAYYQLQGRALSPTLAQFALSYVREWMDRAARANHLSDCALPAVWSVHGLREWLSLQHERADADFRNADATALPAREAVIDSSLQLAPLLCIDGAWLQGFTDAELAGSAWGRALFEIYWDELGNGLYELNHPKIYRDLLRQMGADLPPTGSYEFAHDVRLRNESFELPVLWLCLGKLPGTFLPEILGLNLAMELSGVGGGYRSAHRFLQRYGFDTHFVDLHNTIDNVASGHSAWASDAIDAYMAAQVRLTDAASLGRTWTRIRSGYRALNTPPKHPWITRLGSKLRRGTRPSGPSAVARHHRWTDQESRARP